MRSFRGGASVSLSEMVQTVGIDLGSQKCMLVAEDADIVLTDTGSISRPTLVSFFGKSRLVGEEAAPQVGLQVLQYCVDATES